VLQSDRSFGITPVTPDAQAPGPGAVGCVAEVRLNQELPDGRSNILVMGQTRFTVAELLDEASPYIVAHVEPFEDALETQPSSEADASLRELFSAYYTGHRALNDSPPETPELPQDPLALSFHVAGTIECDLGIKQRLLAERSTAKRVNDLRLLLPLLTSALERAVEVHRRAHSNGKGGTRPDMIATP